MDYRTPAEPYIRDDLDMVDRLSLLPTIVDLTGACPICADYAIADPADLRGVRGHHRMCPLVRHGSSSSGMAMSSSSESPSKSSSGDSGAD